MYTCIKKKQGDVNEGPILNARKSIAAEDENVSNKIEVFFF